MSIHTVLGRRVIWWDNRSQEKYWSMLSTHLLGKFNLKKGRVQTNLTKVIFLEAYEFMKNEFLANVREERNVAFYSLVNGYHEDSIQIYVEQLSGASIEPFIEGDFATYRRILKLVLEQSCDLDLTVGVDLRMDILSNIYSYERRLEDLTFIGYWIYGFAEYVAYLDLVGSCYGVQVDNDNIISVLTFQPFPAIINRMAAEYNEHAVGVIVDTNGVGELKAAIQTHLGISYDSVGSFLNSQRENPELRYGLVPLHLLKENLTRQLGYSARNVDIFIDGLTISRSNKLSIHDSVLKPQEDNRYLYRPILELQTNIGKVCLMGIDKWLESMIQIATNAVPWGFAPCEWKENAGILKYIQSKERRHDALLEDKIESLLVNRNIPFDRNVVSLRQLRGNNVKCDVSGVGEMDIIFLDESNQFVYLLECKYNRSRFDMVSWKKEHSNFINVYDSKLKNKAAWLTQNIETVSSHFALKYGRSFDLRQFRVTAVYAINAPNFYLFDGSYPCFTLYSLERLLDQSWNYKVYEIQIAKGLLKHTFRIARPYFTNAMTIRRALDRGMAQHLAVSTLVRVRTWISKKMGVFTAIVTKK